MVRQDLLKILEKNYQLFNRNSFVENDPISVPHRFSRKQDIEITGFFAATFAWGQRKTIINKSNELIGLMDNTPHDFIVNHKESDLKRFLNFKHRTFNATDTLYFIHFLKHFYTANNSLESAFSLNLDTNEPASRQGKRSFVSRLSNFHQLFFNLPNAPERTKKHVATPIRKSTCKRLCMFLRWMVRKDDSGVDFGIWNSIKPSELHCPLDVHVERVARKLGLIKRKQRDWQTVVELTEALRTFDPKDPVKYDFALFGMSIEEKH